MTTILESFQKLQLSIASFAPLQQGLDAAARIQALTNAGMSQTQARAFWGLNDANQPVSGQGYEFIHQQPNTSSGFSATIFKSNASAEYALAIRGTEFGSTDWDTNVNEIGGAGIAVRQSLDLFNYFQKATAQAGATVYQYSHNQLLGTIGFSSSIASETGELHGKAFSVSGHSLGGHLALVMSRLAPAVTGPVHTTNAPGFDVNPLFPGSESFFQKLRDAELSARGASTVSTSGWSPINLHNLAVTEDAVHQLGTVPSGSHKVFSELGVLGNAITSHDKNGFSDGLALYVLLERIEPSKTVAQITSEGTAILKALSSTPSATLETALDGIRTLFQGSGTSTPPPTAIGDRDSFYTNFYDAGLRQAIESFTGQLSFASLANATTTFLQDGAAADIAYRYALHVLNPFVVLAGSNLYSNHNSGGELDLYESAGRTGSLTSAWIADRAELLTWKNAYFTIDGGVLRGTRDENVLFENRNSLGQADLSLTVVGNLAASGNSGATANPVKVIFGNSGTDALTGGILADGLYGGGGTDWIEGKAGEDSLEGGRGLDLYEYRASRSLGGLFQANDGADVIRDIDGRGVLRYTYTDSGTITSSVIANASVVLSGTQWISVDGKFTFTRSVNDLVVTMNTPAGGNITLKDFRDGDFGIHLGQGRATPQTSGDVIIGDRQPQDPTQTGLFGNLIVTSVEALNRADTLYGGRPDTPADPNAPGEKIDGKGGDDVILSDRPSGQTDNGLGNADWIIGGAGRDQIEAGAGNDLIEAGADGTGGGDVADAGTGNDELHAEGKVAINIAITAGDNDAPLTIKGDLLSGGAGQDWVVGGRARDLLLGGDGEDLILGGAGDDNVWGDLNLVTYTLDWSVNRQAVPEGSGIRYTATLSGLIALEGTEGAADVIYGGKGDDWVFGGSGGDYVDAGADHDVVFGEAGADILMGAAGNDALIGDNPGVVTGADEGGDYLDGGAGQDTLQGNGSADILIGGAGNDVLSGGIGKDIYVFNKGDGSDTIVDTLFGINHPESGVLILGEGFTRDSIKFRLGSLLVDLGPVDPSDPNSPVDEIHFGGFDQVNPTATTPLGEIRFFDGSSMSYADILAQGFDVDGTEFDDSGDPGEQPMLVGTGVTDRIRGFGGNDVLAGLDGDDVLDGGGGHDVIDAGSGNDALIGAAGSDQLQGKGGNDSLAGGEDTDWLLGDAGDDTLVGGSGVDTLHGGADNDTYSFDVQDAVLDFGGSETILFADGLDPEDIDLSIQTFNGQPIRFLTIAGNDPVNAGMGITMGLDALSRTVTYRFSDDRVLTEEEFFQTSRIDSQVLAGGEGNDVLAGYAGGDLLQGHGGNDSLIGGLGNDALRGGSGSDTLEGGSGADELLGGADADVLLGGGGNDQMVGESGSDTYRYLAGGGDDTISDGGNLGDVDILDLEGLIQSDATITRQGSGDLKITLAGGAGSITVTDYYHVPANRIERITFEDGSVIDSQFLDALSLTPIVGTEGNDTLAGTAEDDILLGRGGDDSLLSDAGNDTLQGEAGNDSLRGGGGADVLLGGAGENYLAGAGGHDSYVVLTADIGTHVIDEVLASPSGIGSTDLLDFADMQLANVAFSIGEIDATGLGGNGSCTTLDITWGTGGELRLLLPNPGDPLLTQFPGASYGVEFLRFTGGPLIATSDVVAGFDNDDPQLVSAIADQTDTEHTTLEFVVPAGTFSDVDFGDSLAYTAELESGESLPVWLSFDNQTLTFGAQDAGAGIFNIRVTATDRAGAFASDVFQLSIANVNDHPEVGSAIPTQQAPKGIQFSFIVPGDAFQDADPGDDLTYSASLASGAALPGWLSFNSETKKFSGTPGAADIGTYSIKVKVTDSGDITAEQIFDIQVTSAILGTSADDVIAGASLGDFIFGLAGNDSISAGAGGDTLDGGTGIDTLIGGAGNDTYFVDITSDVVTEAASGGTDTVNSSVTYDLGGEVERLILTGIGNINGIGNGSNNTITGNSGNNTLDGETGADTLIGGAGNDTYIVNSSSDKVTESANQGTADVVMSSASYLIPDNVEILTLTGTGNINATGNSAADTLNGNSGNNTLSGGGGNDTLSGGGGIDSLAGGAGNDVYVLAGGSVSVAENASEGTDTVRSSVSYSLGDNVENLVLTGTGNTNGTGTAANNTLTGNAGNNQLNGGSGADVINGGDGADTLTGGAGNDTYVVNSFSDVVVEAAGAGADHVKSSATYKADANVEKVTLTGGDDIDATGNSAANTLTGNPGDNRLDGKGGADTMSGGSGDDIYTVDNAGDTIVEVENVGWDQINSAVSFTLPNNVEQLALTEGIYLLNGTGNSEDNLLIGNGYFNTLMGKEGNDTLIGAGAPYGFDTLIGGLGDDVYLQGVDPATGLPDPGHIVEEVSEGYDVVQVSDTGSYEALFALTNVEKVMLIGSGSYGTLQISIQTSTSIEVVGDSGHSSIRIIAAPSYKLRGGAGSDTYFVDSSFAGIIENVNDGGTDIVQILRATPSIHYILPDALEELYLAPDNESSNLRVTGNDVNNRIMTGGNPYDGNDTLDGGGGADWLQAGGGDDTYVVDNASDVIHEVDGFGYDSIRSSVSYTLFDEMYVKYVEQLILTGTGNINGTGNSIDNTLDGNSGTNALNGLAGADILDGNGGADSLIGGSGGDVLIYDVIDTTINGGDGTDTLLLKGAGAQLNLTTTPDGKILNVERINITGSGNNTLTLNLQEVLDISSSTDTLRIFGNAGDTVRRSSGWTSAGTQVFEGNTYLKYTQGTATLLVDNDMTSVV